MDNFRLILPKLRDAIFISLFSLLAFLLLSCNEDAEREVFPISKQIVGPEREKIATVNGVEVSLEKFNQLYEARVSRFRIHQDLIRPEEALSIKIAITSQLIDELLIRQAAKKKALQVTDAEVDDAFQQLATTFPNPETFRRYLDSRPKGEQGMRQMLRRRVLKERLAGLEPNEPVSDEDAKAYYISTYDRFNIPAHLIVQEIALLVGPDATAEEKITQKQIAEKVLDMARQPDVSFDTLARRYSQGPTARVGGYLGRVTEDGIDSALWQALRALELNQVSAVVEAGDGYHIVKLIRRNPETRKGFEQVKNLIKAVLREQQRSKRVAKLIVQFRSQAEVKNHLAGRYGK